jgi:hypothetical protein
MQQSLITWRSSESIHCHQLIVENLLKQVVQIVQALCTVLYYAWPVAIIGWGLQDDPVI